MACKGRQTIDRVIALASTQFREPTTAASTGLRLACRLAESGASEEEIIQTLSSTPPEVEQFWLNCRHALFFVDVDYDQWGLEVLDPASARQLTLESIKERPNDFHETDIVLGRFHGDSDLLLIRNDSSAEDFGRVVVALPLDARDDWFWIGLCWSDFLEKFCAVNGQKFWEERGTYRTQTHNRA